MAWYVIQINEYDYSFMILCDGNICLHVRGPPYICVHLRREHTLALSWNIYSPIRIVVIYLEYHAVCGVKSHDGCRGVVQYFLHKIQMKSTYEYWANRLPFLETVTRWVMSHLSSSDFTSLFCEINLNFLHYWTIYCIYKSYLKLINE